MLLVCLVVQKRGLNSLNKCDLKLLKDTEEASHTRERRRDLRATDTVGIQNGTFWRKYALLLYGVFCLRSRIIYTSQTC